MMPREQAPILLVEDNPVDILLLRRAVGKAQITNPLQVVGDGEHAVNYLAGQDIYTDRQRYPLPSLILLDLKLPRRGGLDVLAWLRDQPGLKRLPVVVLTSSNELSDVSRAYDLGANSYLVKPGAPDALTQLVEQIKHYWLILNEPPHITA